MGHDLRYAFRQLLGNPLFTAVAVVTLALGIGANTAIYQVLDAVVFRPLPVREPQRLVQVELLRQGKPQRFNYPLFREMAGHQQVFGGMLATSSFPLHNAVLRGRGSLERVEGVLVSGDYFRVLGIAARLGRTFTAEDERTGTPAAVISDGFWAREFDRSADAVGRTLEINRAVVTIVGVAPRGFFGETAGKSPDVWLPMSLQPQVMATDWRDAPFSNWLAVIARLRPGVTIAEAQAATEALYRQVEGAGRLQVQLRAADRGIDELQTFARPLWILAGIVGLVLLIACCNLANLLVGRAAARAHEIAVRLALGASRSRIVRQLMTESLLLSAISSALALAAAWWGSRALVALASQGGTLQVALGMGWRTGAFLAAVAIGATLVFGLAPALSASRVSGLRTQSGGRSRHVLGKAMVMAQVSLSFLLLAGAALLVRSLWNLRNQDFGFRNDGVLAVNLPLEFNKTMMERNQRIRQPLLERLNGLPGVRSAALSAFGPMAPIQHTGSVSVPERPAREGDYVRLVHISGRYFETMGIRIVAGRSITADDRAGDPPVAVLSQAEARTLFGGADPIGRLVSTDKQFNAKKTFRVVGVAHDVRYTPRDEHEGIVYVPLPQQPAPATEALIATARDAAALAGAARAAIHDLDPDLPVGEIRPLADVVDANLAHERMMAALSACFGIVALLLTCIGVYGVIAYAVKRRTQEIGIRVALGAGRHEVEAMLMREVGVVVFASLVLGGGAAVALTPAIRSQLFGIAPHDYSALLGVAVLLASVAGLASYVPARRASRLDPMAALRME